MLRATFRVLKPGGRVGFRTILTTPGIDAAQKALAADLSPHAGAGPGYPEMMRAAGFTRIEAIDVTTEFLATVNGWLEAWTEQEEGIVPIMGREDYEERMLRRRNVLSAVHQGVLQRQLVTGHRP